MQGSQEQKISSLVNCREIFLLDLCFKLACSLFQFDLIQVVGPFVHTLSHNKKKQAMRYPAQHHFKVRGSVL